MKRTRSAIAAAFVLSPALPLHAADRTPIVSGLAEITDGDTFSIGPVDIRLHGIDAPEAGQTCETAAGKSWACGMEATNRLAEMIEGESVECRPLEQDAYGRIISTCTAGGINLNATMVEEGLAWAFVRYSDDYLDLEKQAKVTHRGVWSGEAQAPWDYRANRWERAAAASPRPGCPIKGNIAADDEKIYHTPWSPWYGRTKINEDAGERWFCDEAEARAAGWRAAKWR